MLWRRGHFLLLTLIFFVASCVEVWRMHDWRCHLQVIQLTTREYFVCCPPYVRVRDGFLPVDWGIGFPLCHERCGQIEIEILANLYAYCYSRTVNNIAKPQSPISSNNTYYLLIFDNNTRYTSGAVKYRQALR